MGTFDKMAENYAKLTGKWVKMNDSGFEEFEAKNPGLATGKPGHNTDNIKIEYKMAENGFKVSFSVDDAEAKTVNYAINGPCEQTYGESKLITTTSFVEGGRMPGGSISIDYSVNGKSVKQENYQFHGPNRMIIETFANDAAMVTVFERQ